MTLPNRSAFLAIAVVATAILATALLAAATPAMAHPRQTYEQAFNCPAQVPNSYSLRDAMVTTGRWNFRVAPYGSGASCTLIRTLPGGTKVTALGSDGAWRYVRLTNTGEEGWIHGGGLRQSLGPVGARTGVIVGASHGGCTIQVDSSIRQHVTALLESAHNAGYRGLCGWGWRSSNIQIQLRRQNCGTSFWAIYQMPSWMCRPPTAIPGTSNHERGLAIDFRSGNQSISAAEFGWLVRNASAFGLFNLPSERWHWSTNGR